MTVERAWLMSTGIITGHRAIIFGTVMLSSILGIVKKDRTSSFVANIVPTGSLLHYQDMPMLNFILAH